MRKTIAIIAVCFATFASSFGASAQSSGSGGIGLSRAEWEDSYGKGEFGQSLVEYRTRDGLPIYVGYVDGTVSSIEVKVIDAENGGLTSDQAESLVEALLPTDAEIDETFSVLASPAHPLRTLQLQTWDSDWLEDNVGDDHETILVILQEDQSENSMDTIVTGVSLLLED